MNDQLWVISQTGKQKKQLHRERVRLVEIWLHVFLVPKSVII